METGRRAGVDAFFTLFFKAECERELVGAFKSAEVAAIELRERDYDEVFFVEGKSKLGFVVTNLAGDWKASPSLRANPAWTDETDTVEDFKFAKKVIHYCC